jgi:ABC-type oligopeptide transport system ATPase subunit
VDDVKRGKIRDMQENKNVGSLLTIDDAQKHFKIKGVFRHHERSVIKAVDGVSLDVFFGEHLGVVGESGSGKSTLARCVMKLYPLDRGRLIWEGVDYTNYSRTRARTIYQHMQMVFQDPYSSLDPRFTVREILSEVYFLSGDHHLSKADKENTMITTLEDVGLRADHLPRYPHEFSGGERQRIAIARALMAQPRLLIFDEAVSSLDVIVQDQILRLLDQLARTRSLTYLFISHNLKVVRKISRRIAVMRGGKIVELADTEDLFCRPLHPYTQGLLRAALDYRSTEDCASFDDGAELTLVDAERNHFARV